MILQALDIAYSYPDGTSALKGLNLSVGRARRLAILGPNGSGKTTLLLHLNGTLKPERGEIRLDGQAVGYQRADLLSWRSQVGLVLQDPDDQLFANSVGEDVSFGPRNAGLDEARVQEATDWALKSLRISQLAMRPPHALSYGQRKRVAIAGAVAMRPQVLLLDEPSAGLDAHGVAHLMALLDHLVEEGMTLVFTTHDVDLALAQADHVALFHQGRVLAAGETLDVLADAALLREARLKRPWALEVGMKARAKGWLGNEAPLPRTREAAMALLDGAP
ncbi:MAG: ATP-binding cassette domain-containing protein [Alphaproteobacteria bacterium]|nr:ATP-binding cassette domain-containing protein [Alphaproteobacteria bacterium]